MIVKSGVPNTKKASSKNLLAHLTRIVANISDSSLVVANRELKDVKSQLYSAKNQLDVYKKEADSKIKLYNKTKLKLAIVKQIDSMRREGIVVGSNKNKMLKILTCLDDQSERQLLKIKNALDVYVPVPDRLSFE